MISLENLINEAKKANIDFGDTEPYNRIRYYTKIGWFPHAVRKTDENGKMTGFYPNYATKLLKKIEKLRIEGKSNEEIAKHTSQFLKVQRIYSSLLDKDLRLQVISLITLSMILIIVLSEIGIIRINSENKDFLYETTNIESTSEPGIFNSAAKHVTIEKGTKQLEVLDPAITTDTKIYLSHVPGNSTKYLYRVENIIEGYGFTIVVNENVEENTTIDYFLAFPVTETAY